DDSSVSSPQTNNLRGRLYRHFDTGGVEQIAGYDFKGNILSTERWLASDYKNVVDWATLPTMPPTSVNPLETTSYTILTNYDALNRIKDQTAPNSNFILPFYNERGLLIRDEHTDGVYDSVSHLWKVKYDARGQRTYVEYANGVYTEYTYD